MNKELILMRKRITKTRSYLSQMLTANRNKKEDNRKGPKVYKKKLF
jgi:hypothetical protein